MTEDQYTQGLIVGYTTAAKLLREGCEDPEVFEQLVENLKEEK
jgi:hypothetical protein